MWSEIGKKAQVLRVSARPSHQQQQQQQQRWSESACPTRRCCSREERHSLSVVGVGCRGSEEGLDAPERASPPPAGPPRMLAHTKVAHVLLPLLRDRAWREGPQGLGGEPPPWVARVTLKKAFHPAGDPCGGSCFEKPRRGFAQIPGAAPKAHE